MCRCNPTRKVISRIEVAEIRSDLPQEPNSFVGREHELDELRKLVSATRMLTLTGPGGIGKTRLALRTLATLADEAVWLLGQV